ncbi:MAG TPA: alpha/beta hydrolase [Flavobacteriales bacterium]
MAVFLFSTLLLLVLVYAGVCLFYWIFQERFIFVRFRVADDHRFRFKQPFTEVFLTAGDGARLHGLHFTVPEPRGVVLYFHGNTGSLRRWGKRAPRFTTQGLDVVMPDYRGYGKSQGRITEAALHDDAARWYAWAAARYPEDRITVYGRSLGTGFAVPVAAHHAPRCLVLESPFANFTDVARHYLAILPYRWLLRYRFRSDKAMARMKCPVYIFHGQRDPIVPYSSALKLYAAVPTSVHRELITFPKGYHSDLAGFGRFGRRMRAILGPPEGSTAP